MLLNIKIEIGSLKKKFGKNDKSNNSNKIKSLEKQINFLDGKYNNIEIKEENIFDNNIPKISDLLESDSNLGSNDKLGPNIIDKSENDDRPIYEEEEKIIDEFKIRVMKQDEQIDKIRFQVGILKCQALEIQQLLKGMNIPNKKSESKMITTIENVKKSTERVNEFIKELRSPSRFCCDIILILILMGLICVLISIIRHKYF